MCAGGNDRAMSQVYAGRCKREKVPRFRFAGTAALLGVLVLMAAFGTALVSHVVIDALGDVLLTNDTYDRVAHHSRLLVCASGGLLGCGFLLRFWLAALSDARGSRSDVREMLREAASVQKRGRIIVGTVVTSILLLVAMESLDAYIASRSAIDLTTALGGSFLLSLSTSCIIGAVSGWIVSLVLGRLAKAYDILVDCVSAAIFAILDAGNRTSRVPEAWYGLIVSARSSLMSRRAAKRAPPISRRFVLPRFQT
ncbi:MAG: hypothetical protein NVS2B17_29320 [Candidatus Velthaea sp.]